MTKATEYKLLLLVKAYARIDYTDDDETLLPLMIQATAQSMQEVIPLLNVEALTARQQLLLLVTVAHLYDDRKLYGKDEDKLRGAAAAILTSEIYEGKAKEAAQ